MFRRILALFILAAGSTAWCATRDEVSENLSRAEALYHSAQFAESIDLLIVADETLRQQPGRLADKINVKLQLALGYIGLNKRSEAKSQLLELYALDSNYTLDPKRFSPKVMTVADEAKGEQNEARCRTVMDDARLQLSSGNRQALRKTTAAGAGCSAILAVAAEAAEEVFKEGVDRYKQDQYAEALKKFREALELHAKHELALQYMDLAQSKLQVMADRALLTWQKNFDLREFAGAATDYRQLETVASPETIGQVRALYRNALTTLVESWNRACSNSDEAALKAIRAQIDSLLPDPSIGEDILATVKTCANVACLAMDSQLALVRLKTRVDPEVGPALRALAQNIPVTVHVTTRINVKGDVTVRNVRGGNAIIQDAIRSAVERWKFYPAIVHDEARCVDTEIPIVLTFSSAGR